MRPAARHRRHPLPPGDHRPVTVEHVSRLAAAWLGSPDPPRWRELEGSAVLADLTGFTRLTEALAGRGDEGAEVLHRALTLCFSSLLEPALAAGGDVIGYAGDAALVWFDGEGHERRAVEAAVAMPAGLARLPAAVTGGRRLRVSVGVHTGRVTAVRAGGRQQGVFLCGPDVSALVALESAAGAGQVVAGRSLAARLPASWCGEGVGDGVVVRRRPRAAGPGPVDAPVPAGSPDPGAAASLLAPAVRRLLAGDHATGDHRTASIGFVSVPGLDAGLRDGGPEAVWRVLHHVAGLVGDVTAEHGLSWLDIDVGAGSVKLLLAAGVPEAVDDDEGRLLVALRRILDESDVPLRAGAQRGRVFAGSLGVRSRRTFTVLGDAANVAARALARAGDGELVVGDGLRAGERTDLRAEPLGAVTLKNRDRPMALWRVDAVARHPATGAAPGTDASAATTMGRERERDRLADRWKEVADGSGGTCVVVGEPGMGGPELLRGLADRAGGAATLVGAHAQRRDVPYGAVAGVVAALAAGAGRADDPWAWLVGHAPALDPTEGAWVAEAEAAVRHRPLPDDTDAVATAQRTRATLVALLAAAAPTPWLLAVDGVDDIDDASRQVVLELCGEAERRRWLVVLGARPGADGGVPAPLDALAAEVVVLEALDDAAARALVLAVEPRRRDDQVALVLAAARGNPFVLAELARHPQGGPLPDSLDRLASARIDALAPAVRRLVRDASAFGATFAAALAARVLDRPELADGEAWRDAAAVVHEVAPGRLAFRHDAYRQAGYRALTFQRRRELHGAIADALAGAGERDASDPDASDAVLAFHLEQAGRQREAFPLAVAAARAARASGATVEAAELFGRSARLARGVERSLLPGLLADQGEALTLVLDLAGADRAFAAAARATTDPLAFASLCVHRAALESRRSRFARARHWVRQGVTVLGPLTGGEADDVRIRLLLEDAGALHDLGRGEESLDLATEALEAARRSGRPLPEALAHLHLEMALSGLERPEAVAHGEAAVALFEAVGHHRLLAAALLNAGVTAMLEGRWEDALDRYRRGAEAARRSGDPRGVAIAEVNTGFVLVRRGDAEGADRCGREALRVFEAGGLDGYAAYARHLCSGAAALDGRAADAEALMAEARAAFARLGDHVMVVDCDVTRAGHLLRAGRPADALALTTAVAADLARAPDELRVFHGLHRGLALARTDDPAAGAALVAEALALAGPRRAYETWSCLDALVAIETAGGPPAPPGAAERAAALAADLALVAPGW